MALGAAQDGLVRYIFVSAFCRLGKGESYTMALAGCAATVNTVVGIAVTLCISKIDILAVLKHVI